MWLEHVADTLTTSSISRTFPPSLPVIFSKPFLKRCGVWCVLIVPCQQLCELFRQCLGYALVWCGLTSFCYCLIWLLATHCHIPAWVFKVCQVMGTDALSLPLALCKT